MIFIFATAEQGQSMRCTFRGTMRAIGTLAERARDIEVRPHRRRDAALITREIMSQWRRFRWPPSFCHHGQRAPHRQSSASRTGFLPRLPQARASGATAAIISRRRPGAAATRAHSPPPPQAYFARHVDCRAGDTPPNVIPTLGVVSSILSFRFR